MKKQISRVALFLSLGAAMASCSPKQNYTTNRDYQIVGTDTEGKQFLAVVTVQYSGLFSSPFLLDDAVDNQNKGPDPTKVYPGLVNALQKEAENVNLPTTEPGQAALLLQEELEGTLKQFNGQRILFQADAVTVGRFVDYYSTCMANMKNFLAAQPEGFYGKPNCSATDSDGDRFISATSIDLKATEKFGRSIQAVFQVPVTTVGGVKLDTEATIAQYPDLEGLGNALQGGNAMPVLPIR